MSDQIHHNFFTIWLNCIFFETWFIDVTFAGSSFQFPFLNVINFFCVFHFFEFDQQNGNNKTLFSIKIVTWEKQIASNSFFFEKDIKFYKNTGLNFILSIYIRALR